MIDIRLARRKFLRSGSTGAALLLRRSLFPTLTVGEISLALPVQGAETVPSNAEDESSLLRDPPRSPAPLDMKALFLGPKAENADLVEEMLLEVYRDYVSWRRNFHPEDPAFITPHNKQTRAYRKFADNFRRELFMLLGQLKSDIPFFSPRYMGHMTADVSLPALIGYIATMLYNPNNVSWEASPITTLIEIEVGRELARMFGFGDSPEELAGTWGHITSGGTVANIESIWVAKAVKFLPIAIRHAALDLGVKELIAGRQHKELERMTAWELVNLPAGEALDLRERFLLSFVEQNPQLPDLEALNRANNRLKHYDILSMGDHAFFSRLTGDDSLQPAVMFAPQTMHYSWVKGPGAVGIGARQVIPVPIDADYRMDTALLGKELERALEEHRPVISLVGVAGTTEEGAIDPMHKLVALREEFAGRGLSFLLHCDAAYGGYLAACFRSADGKWRTRSIMQQEYADWPSEQVYDSFTALKEVDSITVDPHKLGFVPYPAGAIVFRDGRVRDLIAQEAAYALGGRTERKPGEIYIGKYILEGSKPGASAAATYLSHRVVPLDERGYGAVLGQTIRIARVFYDRILEFAETIRDHFIFQPLMVPDTNIIVYLFNPTGNTRLDVMNRFNLSLYGELSIDPGSPIQTRQFIVSHTEFSYELYNPSALRTFLEEKMGVRGSYLVSREKLAKHRAAREVGYDNELVVFRTTLMNPFTLEAAKGKDDYIQLFCKALMPLLNKSPAEVQA